MDEPSARAFRIGPCVGRGGFGEVYRATMRTAGGLETEVALKVLRPDPARRADAPRRFRDEGRMLSRLQHPAVVRAFDWADLGDGQVALVTEYVDGADLHACAVAGIETRPLLEAIGAVAAALDAAWRTPGPDGAPLRVVHRDVKPTNVRLGRHGQVRLLDFGIARFGSEERESRTESDLVVGSMPYMAPERFAERTSSTAADVYGLGCCLYEGLAREPFHTDARLRDLSALALDRARFDDHRARRLAALRELDPEIVALLERCLAHDPADRPAAAEVASTCERLADRVPGPTLRRWCADHPPAGGDALVGSWTGRTVTEGEAADDQAPDTGRPRVVHAPGATIDPDLLDALPATAEPAPPPLSRSAPDPAPPSPGLGARAALALVGGLGCALLLVAAAGGVALLIAAVVKIGW